MRQRPFIFDDFPHASTNITPHRWQGILSWRAVTRRLVFRMTQSVHPSKHWCPNTTKQLLFILVSPQCMTHLAWLQAWWMRVASIGTWPVCENNIFWFRLGMQERTTILEWYLLYYRSKFPQRMHASVSVRTLVWDQTNLLLECIRIHALQVYVRGSFGAFNPRSYNILLWKSELCFFLAAFRRHTVIPFCIKTSDIWNQQ